MMTLYKNMNSMVMKTVGTVVFIQLLLLIAGVEPNPGPADVLVFRYQYLLVEVGTFLLRKLFDVQVNNDLVQFLKTNPKCAKQLKILIDNDIISADQKTFLPPLNNNPDTANFDITLLTCLLRNICGLKDHRDPVWQNPPDGDLSVEAEITRVKERRNYVVHKGTVHISESDFNLMWKTLCQTLHRLNKFCGVPNLTEMIDDAYSKPLDDQLKQQHDNILKAWHEAEYLFEKGIIDIKQTQSEIKDSLKAHTKLLQNVEDNQEETKRRLDNIEQACSSNERAKLYTNEGIKECLKKSYEKDFSTMCVTPLYSEDDSMDMLTVYTRPKMKHVPYHKARQSEGNYDISSYEQVFCKDNTAFTNIFVTGDAGMGKTSYCQFMSLLWSKYIAGDITGNKDIEDIQADASFMTNFDFVFYILLKETNREDVVSMIVDKYFNTSSEEKSEETKQQIEQILETKKCLVILDGLDEWIPDICGNRNLSLPRTISSDKCTYLTTCRQYIIETVRLSEKDIGHQVQITGFDHEKYIREVVDYINKSQNTNKDPDDFLRQIAKSGMKNQLHIPLITSQLIVVWFKYEISNMSRSMLYGSIIEMLFERAAVKNQIEFHSMASADVHLPESFSRFTFLRKYVGTLEKACMLSFLLLFDPDNKTSSLVFTKNQLMSEPYNISQEEIDLLCQLGIISKNKEIASFGEQKHMLSFLHTSYLEFLAALFVSLYNKTDLFCEAVANIFMNRIGKYQNFLILLSGISSQLTRLFFEMIYMVNKGKFDLLRSEIFSYRKRTKQLDFIEKIVFDTNLETMEDVFIVETTFNLMQDIILCCFREIISSGNSQRFIKLEDFMVKRYSLPEDGQNVRALLNLNKYNVKSLVLVTNVYLDEFSVIKGLQCLAILLDFNWRNKEVDDRFNDVILNNQLTLHCLKFHNCTLLSALPVRSLPYLRSVCFQKVTIKHNILHELMNYISGNTLLERVLLDYVKCIDHETDSLVNVRFGGFCILTLDLSDHSNLQTVHLHDIFLECYGINTSCLTSLSLGKSTYRCPRLMNGLNIKQNSKLKNLHLDGHCIHHSEAIRVWEAIQSLKFIEHLELEVLTIQDSLPLQFDTDIVCHRYRDINLEDINMSDKCFQELIDSILNQEPRVTVRSEGMVLDHFSDNRVQRVQAGSNFRIKYYKYSDQSHIDTRLSC